MTSFFLYSNNKFCGKILYYTNCDPLLCNQSIKDDFVFISFQDSFFQAIAVYERTVSFSSVSEVKKIEKIIV